MCGGAYLKLDVNGIEKRIEILDITVLDNIGVSAQLEWEVLLTL